MLNDSLFSSDKMTWGTPQPLFNKLNDEFKFTIDLCADKTNYKLPNYYNQYFNSLVQSWDGIIGWCNPPYGSEIGKWIEKGYKAKNSIIVMLIPSRTDTKYWHDYVMKAKEIRFIKGRLKFEDENRKPSQGAPFPSAIIVFDGDDHDIPIISSFEVK